MPIWLRKFTWNKLTEWFKPKDENENSWVDPKVKSKVKDISKKITPPSYVTKAKK